MAAANGAGAMNAIVIKRGRPGAVKMTDLYCNKTGGGCGSIFWVAEAELAQPAGYYGDWLQTLCPVCKRKLEVNKHRLVYIPKLPIALPTMTTMPTPNGGGGNGGGLSASNDQDKKDEGCSSSNSASAKQEGAKQDQPPAAALCCICEERPPDTRVKPCGHSVVCQECSIDLQQTADSDHCVVCRRPITKIELRTV